MEFQDLWGKDVPNFIQIKWFKNLIGKELMRVIMW